VQDAIFYQIFPDRFANGDPSNDPPNVQPWGAEPDQWGFQGGDLRGIHDRLDYLLDLGVTAIYLNPIFQATSNHRYNTGDYLRIDPLLGDLADFRALRDAAHARGLRLILDGVFNHSGRTFAPFADLLENGEHSAYRDWFHIRRFPIDAYSPGDAQDYLAWWGIKSLPKFNTRHPAARRYLLDVTRYWLEQGIDGWRLDVPNEIDDGEFWDEFSALVKRLNPEAYLLGEIWTADPAWVGPTRFDGLMNYPLRDDLLRLLYAGTLSVSQFAAKIDALLATYPAANTYAMYNPLGSHDTERILTKLEGDERKLRLALAFQFAYPGAPAIYYGDEIGLTGGKDPQCRRAFPWQPDAWNGALRSYVQRLIGVRKERAALRRGAFVRLLADDALGVYAFARTLDGAAVAALFNPSDAPNLVRLATAALGWGDGQPVHDLLSGKELGVRDGALEVALAPWGARLLATV
jgi:glycosidase